MQQLDRELTRRMFDVNVIGLFLCCKYPIQRMATSNGGSGGIIVIISPASSHLGGVGSYIDFASSKAALDTMTTATAKEQAEEGIRVNCLRPGFIITEGNRQWMEDHPGWAESVIERIPIGRAGELDDVATATLWLLSEEAKYVTSAILDVSGGSATP